MKKKSENISDRLLRNHQANQTANMHREYVETINGDASGNNNLFELVSRFLESNYSLFRIKSQLAPHNLQFMQWCHQCRILSISWLGMKKMFLFAK